MIESVRGDSGAWELPDGLGYSRLREVRLTGGGILIMALAAVMAIGGVAAGIALTFESKRQSDASRLLRQEGVRADAIVTRRWRSGGKDAQGWISYRFTYQAATYEKRLKPPRRIWTNLTEGDTLPIRFVPSNPVVSHPEDWTDSPTPLWLPYLLGALLILPAGLLVSSVRRQSSLLAEGQAAQGVITRQKRADHGQTANYYEFRLLSGAVANGRTVSRKAVPIGQQVPIIYDPDNPKRNAMYPLPFVRLANVRKSQPDR